MALLATGGSSCCGGCGHLAHRTHGGRRAFRADTARCVDHTPHPHLGRRVGEADNPGPPQASDVAARRERALHALGQMRLLPPDGRAASEAETLSDTLSANTPFASPRDDEPFAHAGEVAPTLPGEATPGFTPTEVPAPPEQMAGLVLGEWSGCGPPCTRDLPARNSWLYVPLLHAASATLAPAASGQWVAHPVCGVRWQALVHTLARAEPVPAAQLVALCRAVAVLDDDAEVAVVEAEALCRRLDAHADRLVSLPTAFACACDAYGYAPAVAQAALLEAYGGPAVAAEAAKLADALRACEPPSAHAAASPTRTGRPRRGRRNRTPVESSARRGGGDSSDAASAAPTVAPTAACLAQPARRPASPPTLEALDAVDLLA